MVNQANKEAETSYLLKYSSKWSSLLFKNYIAQKRKKITPYISKYLK